MKFTTRLSLTAIIFVLSTLLLSLMPVQRSRRSETAIRRVTPNLKIALSKKKLTLGSPIFIRIFKASNELEIWVQKSNEFILFKIYQICYYSGKLGPKLAQGDLQAPEGFYFVTSGRMNPFSTFHLSFDIGYPNSYDRYYHRTGGNIAVHGNCVSIGCFAMTDEYIEEIFTLAVAALENGQSFFRIHIFPFRMTEENLSRYNYPQWKEFWQNLKEGYDYFKFTQRPPNVLVRNGKYVFEDE